MRKQLRHQASSQTKRRGQIPVVFASAGTVVQLLEQQTSAEPEPGCCEQAQNVAITHILDPNAQEADVGAITLMLKQFLGARLKHALQLCLDAASSCKMLLCPLEVTAQREEKNGSHCECANQLGAEIWRQRLFRKNIRHGLAWCCDIMRTAAKAQWDRRQ